MKRSAQPTAVTILTIGLALLFATPALAIGATGTEPVGSATLVDRPAAYDGSRVDFEGEAIAAPMPRAGGTWLHLNDDAYARSHVLEGAGLGGYNSGMPVWVPGEGAAAVKTFGDHRHVGDLVRVSGTFNAACAEHGGDMDIHATELVVSAPGRRVHDPVDPWKLPAVVVMGLLAGVAFFAERRAGRHERTGLS